MAKSMMYHITIYDETGAEIPIENLTRVEVDEFNQSHETDDLDYSITYDFAR